MRTKQLSKFDRILHVMKSEMFPLHCCGCGENPDTLYEYPENVWRCLECTLKEKFR